MIVDALLAATVFATGLNVHDVEGVFGDLETYRMFGGVEVTADSALQTTAVLACVRVLAETMAVLPFHVYESGGPAWPGSKRMATYKVPTHRLRRVLQYEPNQWQTGFEFREMMMGHLALRGNAYAVIIPGGRDGAIGQLIPKHPDRMKVVRLENGRLGYLYRPEKSLKPEKYTQDEIFHVRGLSSDGLTGLSPIALGRRAVDLAQQGEDHGLKFFKNMAKPGGVLEMPEGQTLDDEDQHRRLRNSWREAHSGSDLFSVAFLEDGMKLHEVGMSNEDGQWLDSRRFQVPEVCRIFRVPPHMVYAAIEHGHTYANIEQSDLAFVKHTMTPWVVCWEQAIWRDLLVDQDQYYPKFSMEGLLRGDSKARAEYAKVMVDMGAWNPNDVRELDEKNPYEGGDTYTIAAGRVPLTAAGVIVPVTGQQQEASETVEQLPLVLPEPTVVDAMAVEGPIETPLACVVEWSGGEWEATLPKQGEPWPQGSETRTKATSLVKPWLADIAGRIAKAEIEQLSKRAGHASSDRTRFDKWASDYWTGKHAAYVAKTVAPLLASCESEVTPEQAAQTVAERAIKTLAAGDPVAVLETWKETRATQLAELLMEAIRDGHDNE